MTEEQKQVLIEHAKSWIADCEAMRDEIPFGFDDDTEKELSLIKIALAALTAPPDDWKRRAEAAEAKLSELAKQEPVAYGLTAETLGIPLSTRPAPAVSMPDEVIVLLVHLEDILPDAAFNLIDVKLWNAVSALSRPDVYRAAILRNIEEAK